MTTDNDCYKWVVEEVRPEWKARRGCKTSSMGEGNSTVVQLHVGYAWWPLYCCLVSLYTSNHNGCRRNEIVIFGWNRREKL
ncbi:hypothetical protein Scep_024882 [Stephania cephalantha]|uniref:Uncharacterized protein n=1 Tax=Stephania cephalantha TaxID=152367 RepID=A0AAP0F095_9MAGN